MSSWETVVVRVQEEVAKQAPRLRMTTVQPFYQDTDYIAALHAVIAPAVETAALETSSPNRTGTGRDAPAVQAVRCLPDHPGRRAPYAAPA